MWGSRRSAARSRRPAPAWPGDSSSPGSSGYFLDHMVAIELGGLDLARRAARPAYAHLHRTGSGAEAETDAPVVLAREAAARRHDLQLAPTGELALDLRADRAGVRRAPAQAEADPAVVVARLVAVDEQRPLLVGDDEVERAVVEQVDERHGAAIELVGDSDLGAHLEEARVARALVEQHARALV